MRHHALVWMFLPLVWSCSSGPQAAPPTDPVDEPVVEREPFKTYEANPFFADWPAAWHPPIGFDDYTVPATRYVDTEAMASRGASSDDALVHMVVICETGCSQCEKAVPGLAEFEERFPWLRVSHLPTMRFGDSERSAVVFEQAKESGDFWTVYDFAYDVERRGHSWRTAQERLNLPPLDEVPKAKAEDLRSRLAAESAEDEGLWTNTPTVYVNGIPVVGVDNYAVERLIVAQARDAHDVYLATGLRGHDLYREVAGQNAAADRKRREERTAAEQACTAGDADACMEAGESLLFGLDGRRHTNDGVELWSKACDLGSAEGCYQTRSGAESRSTTQQACDAGSASACQNLALQFGDFSGLERACSEERTAGCGLYAAHLVDTGSAEGAELAKRACIELDQVAGCLVYAGLAEADEAPKFARHGLAIADRDSTVVIDIALFIAQATKLLPNDRDWLERIYRGHCFTAIESASCEAAATALGFGMRPFSEDDGPRLVRFEAAPGLQQMPSPPEGVEEVRYNMEDLELAAWWAPQSGDAKAPTLVFLHDGYSLWSSAWDVARVAHDAGYNVLLPTYRGENGNPGHFEMFLAEASDVSGAIYWAGQQAMVEPSEVYLFGVGTGGHLAIVFAGYSKRARLTGSAGAPLAHDELATGYHRLPFDPHDAREWAVRSGRLLLHRIPGEHHAFVGSDDDDVASWVSNENAERFHVHELPAEGDGYAVPALQKFLEIAEQARADRVAE